MNLPNKLSTARILMIPLFVIAYFLPFHWSSYLAAGIFVLAALTDFLDGHIARKRNMVTNLGKLLDPIADKVLVCAALFCIVCTNPLRFGSMLFPAGCFARADLFGQVFLTVSAILIVARELIISVVRQVAASKSIVVQANIYGKIKTVLQDIALPMLIVLNGTFHAAANANFFDYLWIGAVAVTLAAVIMTVISGFIYIIQNKKVFVEND